MRCAVLWHTQLSSYLIFVLLWLLYDQTLLFDDCMLQQRNLRLFILFFFFFALNIRIFCWIHYKIHFTKLWMSICICERTLIGNAVHAVILHLAHLKVISPSLCISQLRWPMSTYASFYYNYFNGKTYHFQSAPHTYTSVYLTCKQSSKCADAFCESNHPKKKKNNENLSHEYSHHIQFRTRMRSKTDSVLLRHDLGGNSEWNRRIYDG